MLEELAHLFGGKPTPMPEYCPKCHTMRPVTYAKCRFYGKVQWEAFCDVCLTWVRISKKALGEK